MVLRIKFFASTAVLILTSATTPVFAQAGDPGKGRVVFARCAICHDVKAGPRKIGPNLSGLFGRVSGSAVGFSYSPAMLKAKIRWDDKTIDAFIAKPSAVVPGNRMGFAGLPQANDRANLIAFLKKETK